MRVVVLLLLVAGATWAESRLTLLVRKELVTEIDEQSGDTNTTATFTYRTVPASIYEGAFQSELVGVATNEPTATTSNRIVTEVTAYFSNVFQTAVQPVAVMP